MLMKGDCVKMTTMQKPRIIFMGSPEFAVPILQKLMETYPVVGVVTQPDRPSGRGQIPTPPPVKLLAKQNGLTIFQPRRLKDPGVYEELASRQPDLIVVAAFGQILRQNILDLPVHGCVNVHASILPRWRGAAPIQAAILAGDLLTGITIMKMDAGVDTGAILSQISTPIDLVDTAQTLGERLAFMGADLLVNTIPGYLDGSIRLIKQNDELATYAHMIQKEQGELDFSRTAEELERQIRAFFPWPGSYFQWMDSPMKVHAARVETVLKLGVGEHGVVDGLPAIGTSRGVLVLTSVQPAGKKVMPGRDFLRGTRHWCSL